MIEDLQLLLSNYESRYPDALSIFAYSDGSVRCLRKIHMYDSRMLRIPGISTMPASNVYNYLPIE